MQVGVDIRVNKVQENVLSIKFETTVLLISIEAT